MKRFFTFCCLVALLSLGMTPYVYCQALTPEPKFGLSIARGEGGSGAISIITSSFDVGIGFSQSTSRALVSPFNSINNLPTNSHLKQELARIFGYCTMMQRASTLGDLDAAGDGAHLMAMGGPICAANGGNGVGSEY